MTPISITMPANKKTTAKTSKSPAPANKVTTSTVRKSPVAKATTSAPVAKARVPEVASSASEPVLTRIVAQIDAGFGNAIYIRGEGPGLSWDSGVPLTCVGAEEWQFTVGSASKPFAFKLLVNDVTWSTGADLTIRPGEKLTVTPTF